MSRRGFYGEAPRCSHVQAIWDRYEAEYAAWESVRSYVGMPERPKEKGYCDPCWTALCANQAEPWPADVWEYLHALAKYQARPAALDYTGKPYKLLPAPKARTEPLAKWLTRARAAFRFGTCDPKDAGRVSSVHGRPVANGNAAPWKIDTTNGHCALLVPGGDSTEKPLSYMSAAGSEHWIDLPQEFYLALRRVRLLSNERSNAIKLSFRLDGVTLSASCPEYGLASEEIDAPTSWDLLPPDYTCCLSAEYLDACCGVWPLRWYVRLPEQRTTPATRYSAVRTTLDELPQLFAPGDGTQARVLIMPMMRI